MFLYLFKKSFTVVIIFYSYCIFIIAISRAVLELYVATSSSLRVSPFITVPRLLLSSAKIDFTYWGIEPYLRLSDVLPCYTTTISTSTYTLSCFTPLLISRYLRIIFGDTRIRTLDASFEA